MNEKCAGAICNWNENTDGWEIYSAQDPLKADSIESKERIFLHAKYICVAFERNNKLSHSKFYVGSGNITRMGLLSAFSKSANPSLRGGNIEAGIVFDVEPNLAEELLVHGNRILDLSTLELGEGFYYKNKDVVPVCPISYFEVHKNNTLIPHFIDAKYVAHCDEECRIILSNKTFTIKIFDGRCKFLSVKSKVSKFVRI